MKRCFYWKKNKRQKTEKTNDTPKMGFIGFLHTYKIKKMTQIEYIGLTN